MNLEAISAVMKLCDHNVENLLKNIISYQNEVNAVRQALNHVERVDGRWIALHDRLLKSLSHVNASVNKLNLNINLNRAGSLMAEEDCEKHLNKNGSNLGEPKSSPLEGSGSKQLVAFAPKPDPPAPATPGRQQQHMMVAMHSSWVVDTEAASFNSQILPVKPTSPRQPSPQPSSASANFHQLTVSPRQSPLLPPKGGNPLPTLKVYDQVSKNIAAFPEGSIVQATVMHLSIADNCLFVARWDDDKSKPIKMLLEGHLPLQELDQLPDFGEVFAIYDALNRFVPRAIINDYAEGGGYEAYLLDYGEHVQLHDKQNIFDLSEEIKKLPAEAIKCYLSNGEVSSMSEYMYNDVALRVLDNNGVDIKVELIKEEAKETKREEVCSQEMDSTAQGPDLHSQEMDLTAQEMDLTAQECALPSQEMDLIGPGNDLPSQENDLNAQEGDLKGQERDLVIQDGDLTGQERDLVIQEGDLTGHERNLAIEEPDLPSKQEEGPLLSEAQLAMLNEIDEGTSDAVKAVLGFKPKDDERLCRHYDPELNGCFKGNNCHLVHQLSAPHGATKDQEVAAPLPESVFVTSLALHSTVRVQVTFISSTTQVYAQVIDKSPPLVWSRKDVPKEKRIFKQKPNLLDMVLARYSDGCFYRAQVMEDFGNGEYKIFYVDYGNTEFVPLRALSPCGPVEGLKPHRAIPCQFEGLVPKAKLSNQKTQEGIEYLKSKILNMEFEVEITHQLPDGYIVRLLADYAIVPEQLVKRGYAQILNGTRREDLDEQDDNASDSSSF